MIEEMETKIAEERCVETGGHCWDFVQWDPEIATAGYLYRKCRHCDKVQQAFCVAVDEDDDLEQEPIGEDYLPNQSFTIVFTRPQQWPDPQPSLRAQLKAKVKQKETPCRY